MPVYEIQLIGKLTINAPSPDKAVQKILNMPTLPMEMHLIFDTVTPISAIYKPLIEAVTERKILDIYWDLNMVSEVLATSVLTLKKWIKEGKHFNPDKIKVENHKYSIERREVERILRTRVNLAKFGTSILIK